MSLEKVTGPEICGSSSAAKARSGDSKRSSFMSADLLIGVTQDCRYRSGAEGREQGHGWYSVSDAEIGFGRGDPAGGDAEHRGGGCIFRVSDSVCAAGGGARKSAVRQRLFGDVPDCQSEPDTAAGCRV